MGTLEGKTVELLAELKRLGISPESAPVAATKPMTVAAVILELLRSRGVDRVFGIPGGPISPLIDALLDTNIRFITCQHETMAVYVAAGYAKATGRPGVVMVTSGPGILNALTGVASAFHDEIPLLVFAGEVATQSAGRGALQDGGPHGLDIERMFEPITRAQLSLVHERRAAPMIDQAWAKAMSHPRGPVLIRVPADIFPRRAAPFHDVPTEPVSPPQPTMEQMWEIARMLGAAKRPAIFAGLGAKNSGAAKALLRLAEAAQCPVITDLEAKGIIPESHPLALGVFGVGARGSAASFLSEGIDLMIAVGTRFDDTTTANFSPLLQGNHTFVQLDYDPERLGRAYTPHLAVTCDLPAALNAIASMLPEITAEQLVSRRWQLDGTGGAPEVPPSKTPGVHDPRAAARAIQEAFGGEAVFSCDIGNHLLFTAQAVSVESADDFHVAIGLGGMGSGLGTAIGLQLAMPDKQVVAVIGDGGLLMVGSELATAAALDLPLLVVVFNDRQLGMVEHGHQRLYGRSQAFETPELDLCAYGQTLGFQVARIEDLRLLRGVSTMHRLGPLLLELPVDADVRPLNPRERTLNLRTTQAAAELHAVH